MGDYLLNQLYFYLTKGCNLRCRHCWLTPPYHTEDRPSPVLDFALFKSIIEQAKPLGLSGVKLTGGEPLLHPQINKILEFIQEKGLSLTVETNGILCTPELSRAMALCQNPSVSVSLDGADAETHEWVRGLDGCFNLAMRGFRNLVQAGLRPQIVMTVMRRNREQLEAVVRLAEEMGAGSVKFNIVQPTGRGEKMYDQGEVLGIEELVDLGRWIENTLFGTTKLRLLFDQPLAFRSLSKMFAPQSGRCDRCGILGIAGVLPDGSYALCGIGEEVPELVFGHAANDSLEDIWNHNKILEKIRKGLPDRLEGICGDCLMKRICLGSCIAQNYYGNKNLWAPFWFCEAAKKRGFFPQNRMILKNERRNV